VCALGHILHMHMTGKACTDGFSQSQSGVMIRIREASTVSIEFACWLLLLALCDAKSATVRNLP
jgi:hypothetical protein